VIVPIRSGSGTRLKVLEAGACRRPVVSTAIGVEGLRMIPDQHCLIDDAPEGFAAKCVEVLHDEQMAGRLADELYDFVKSTYDGPRVQDGIRNLFEPLAAGH
jgi:glycosyltransferase involved in cell wall biosynthesis